MDLGLNTQNTRMVRFPDFDRTVPYPSILLSVGINSYILEQDLFTAMKEMNDTSLECHVYTIGGKHQRLSTYSLDPSPDDEELTPTPASDSYLSKMLGTLESEAVDRRSEYTKRMIPSKKPSSTPRQPNVVTADYNPVPLSISIPPSDGSEEIVKLEIASEGQYALGEGKKEDLEVRLSALYRLVKQHQEIVAPDTSLWESLTSMFRRE